MYKKTSLYARHIAAGGKMVEFAGYEMPIQYSSIVKEHNMVRQRCGLFDVSHMGEISVTGPEAAKLVQYLVTVDVSEMEPGDVKYTPMCYETGGCVDDVLVYKKKRDFLLVVNASNVDKDFEWIKKNNKFDAEVNNISSEISQIAIQGPMAEEIVLRAIDCDDLPQKYYTFIETEIDGCKDCIISRTGYTGEDGFEIYLDNEFAPKVWDELIIAGGEDICPCGLGARDTLRLEAGMPLYGSELSADITPLEAGLDRFVALDSRDDFLGKASLAAQKENGLNRRRCFIELTGKGIGREGNLVFMDDIRVGYLTSGSKSITLDKSIGLAMIKLPYNKTGGAIQVNIRNKNVEGVIIRGPFYKRKK